MKFHVTDRYTIEAGLPISEPCIIISIRSPGMPEPQIVQPENCRGIHYAVFHDAEPADVPESPWEVKLMTPCQAEDIVRFFNQHRPHVELTVVHCEAGWSRSPAVAAALARSCDQEDSFYFENYQPNAYVHTLVTEATKAGAVRFDPGSPSRSQSLHRQTKETQDMAAFQSEFSVLI